jgi:hypothetical protein
MRSPIVSWSATAKQGTEAVLLHHLARPLYTIFAEPVPVDALLPVRANNAKIRSHRVLPLVLLPCLDPRVIGAFTLMAHTSRACEAEPSDALR